MDQISPRQDAILGISIRIVRIGNCIHRCKHIHQLTYSNTVVTLLVFGGALVIWQ